VNRKLSTTNVAGGFVRNIDESRGRLETERDTWICDAIIDNHVCTSGACSFDGCPGTFQRSVAGLHAERFDLIGVQDGAAGSNVSGW